MKKNKKQKYEKKWQKIAKFIYTEFKEQEKQRYELQAEVKMTEDINQLNWADYDEKISKKFTNFILNLIKLKDRIRVEIRNDCIYINGNIDNNFQNYKSPSVSPEDIIDIRITQAGFSISRNYGTTISYKDEKIYNLLCDEIKSRSQEINRELLVDLIDDVMIKTNLNRGSNLDQILN